jgi:hypothetical protein
LLYGLANFSPDDFFWDGTLQGKSMNNGVYVFYFEYETKDGQKRVRKGDVTILK